MMPQAQPTLARNPARRSLEEPRMSTTTDPHQLEQELEQLLEVERFEPTGFEQHHADEYRTFAEEAEAAPTGFWAPPPRALLDWSNPSPQVLDAPTPPFYKWFADGELNVSYNCLDRHVEAGNGARVAFHWHGEEGESRAVTYSDLLAETQKLANGLKSLGIGK